MTLLTLILSALALAHTTILPNADLVPRTENPGLKRPPCGNVARSPSPKVHRAGSVIDLEWKEVRECK